MSGFSCPNCGDQVDRKLAIVKMVTCDSCQTTLFLANDKALAAGQGGDMHDAPLLFKIGDQVRLGNTTVDVYGHARYSYGRGFWDEFWGVTAKGDPVWVSVDEGDVVLQHPLADHGGPRLTRGLQIGASITFNGETYRIVEIEEAECVALRGSFDEPMDVGDTHRFINAQGDRDLLSGEFWDGHENWYLGAWHDPYDIKVKRAS